MHSGNSDNRLAEPGDMQHMTTLPTPPRRRARWPVYLVLLAMILVPAVFWRQVWWGSPLSDQDISERLKHPENVRQTQHALEQLSQRLGRDPESARRFYPQVIALSEHPEPLLRSAVAWLMGEDNRHEPFREHLLRLLGDGAPLVRYNAAIALTRFGDAAARPVLREMLGPHVITAGVNGNVASGTVLDVLHQGDFVRHLTQLALVDRGGGQQDRILAPLEGRLTRVNISKGGRVEPGDEIAAIAPNAAQVEAALRALYLIGRAEDIEAVESYVEPPAGFPDRVAQQARATEAAIRHREDAG